MTGSHEVNGSIPLCSTIFSGGLTFQGMCQTVFLLSVFIIQLYTYWERKLGISLNVNGCFLTDSKMIIYNASQK